MKNSMIRKSQPSQSDVHVDRPLTNISVAYMQSADNFVADKVFPSIPVQKASDLYFEFPRGFFNRNEMAKRALSTESKGVGYDVQTKSYSTDVWSLHHDVDDRRRDNADQPLDPDREAVELLSMQGLISKEVEWVNAFFTSGKWSTDFTPSTLWDAANSTPLKDIEAQKLVVSGRTGFEPNTLVVSRKLWGVLRNHPDIVDRIKYGQTGPGPAMVSRQAVAQLLELDQILVSSAIQNTAKEGATDSHSFIADNDGLLVYVAPNPGLYVPSGGYTFNWTGYTGAGPGGQRISRFRMEQLKSDRVEIELAYAQKLVSADLGVFILNPIA